MKNPINRTMIRYALFQVPGLILMSLVLTAAVRWLEFFPHVAYWIVGLWIAKDIALYPFTRVAYHSGDSMKTDRLLRARGIAKEPLDPSGYISVSSELWRAEIPADCQAVPMGSAVQVVGIRGLTLLVEPIRSHDRD